MSPQPTWRRFSLPWLVAACAAPGIPSCGGELIPLGDATIETSSNGGETNSADGGADARQTGGVDGVAMRGSGGGDSCPSSGILARQVLWIGDSWIRIPGAQHTRVRDLARSAALIGPTEEYENLAAPAADMAAVARQYETQRSGANPPKVLLMNGGTWDAVAAQLSGADVDAAIDESLAEFSRFLAQVATDGSVQHIVYFLVPELPSIPGVAAMRGPLQQACGNSAVPCHFIDLQPLWLGHPEYTAADGIQASVAGANVIADAIWSTMQDRCIAQ